jgi:hypothetical protein
MQRFEYRVVQLRESLVGGKLSADKLEEILNDEARKGLDGQGHHVRGG